ncbi:MAG TPA: ribonuclease J [Anaeromyxobacteraceae bacterium]|nr:ribonuclease J [Anaeromyxobacteraceae bacterium]
MAPPVRVAPLGGLGEIGMNCLALECEGRVAVVDCGLLFPPGGLGVEAVAPDLRWLEERRDRVGAVLVTHGHEDHIGALPLLLRAVRAPVYGPALALSLLRPRLEEAGVRAELREVRPGDRIRAGDGSPFAAEFVAVAHSVPDSCALAVETPQGLLVHSGDFKVDERPVAGRRTDLPRFEELGRAGVRMLLSDSTNADRPGHSPSESEVGPALRRVFDGAPGRVWVTCFSSHMGRIQQVADAARAYGRRLALVGRSMEESVRLGLELGYLSFPPGQLATAEEARDAPPRELCALLTGSQGEPHGALARLSRGELAGLAAGPLDRVVFSARLIPGNEVAIGQALDGLARRGADVLWEGHRTLHVSGHAQEDEERLLIRLTRPEHFVPIHGGLRQLLRHAGHAASEGVPDGRRHVLVDGEVLELSDAGAARVPGGVPAGRVHLSRDGGLLPLAHSVVRERRMLSEHGLVLAVVALDRATRELARPVEVRGRGAAGLEGREAELAAEAGRAVSELPAGERGTAQVEAALDRAVRGWFRRASGRRPAVESLVLEV